MRIHGVLLGLAAGLGLAACADVTAQSGPPVAGTTVGPGAAPLVQQTRDTAGSNSANASSGTATISGVRNTGDSGARPEVSYSGTAPGTGAGTNQIMTPTPPSRANKGGG